MLTKAGGDARFIDGAGRSASAVAAAVSNDALADLFATATPQ
jgi:hypothetical protein